MDSLIIFSAKYLFLAVVLFWILAWLQAGRGHKKQMSLATLAAVIIAAVLDKLAGKLYYDPRPFVSHNLHPLIAHSADNGFPSEHTLFSMVLAAVLVFYRPKAGYLAILIALLVGSSRVAAHVHSPIDIAGGAILGFAAGYFGYWLARKYLPLKAERHVTRGGGQPAGPK